MDKPLKYTNYLPFGWSFYTIFLAFVVLFCFLASQNVASTDDFFLGTQLEKNGFWGYQVFIYQHWGGRYTSNFLGAVFAHKSFLFNNYWIHSIFLLSITYIGIFFVLHNINKYWWYSYFAINQLIFYTVVLLLTLCSILPEFSTAFYWFSSSITYQFSAALLLIELALLIKYFHKPGLLLIAGISIDVVIINGCNEIAALTQGLLLISFGITHYKSITTNKKWFLIVFPIYIISLIVSSNAPGNQERLAQLSNGHFITAIGSTFIRLIYTYWNLAQSALFVIVLVVSFWLGVIIGTNVSIRKRGNSFTKNLLILLAIQLIMLTMISIPILYLSNGSWPERATNLMVIIAGSCLLFTTVYCGMQCTLPTIAKQLNTHPFLKNGFIIILAFLSISNQNSKQLFVSAWSASLYNQTVAYQHQLLKAQKGAIIAQVPDYGTIFKQNYLRKYPTEPRAVVKQFITNKPSCLFVYDDFANEASKKIIAGYYNIDSLIVIPEKEEVKR